ncbi:MAG TPA: hypothetical protein VF799_09460 [Geobacteraceae bacterium]
MDHWYQGVGPDERLALSQLFREMGKEDRGAPEIEMSGQFSRHPACRHGMKRGLCAQATPGGRGEKAGLGAAPL